MTSEEPYLVEELLAGLREFQDRFGPPASDLAAEAPAAALHSLEAAVAAAPRSYRPYLEEAVACYSAALYRAAILMTWSATMRHLLLSVETRAGGVKAIEACNRTRFGASKGYRQIKKVDDILYLRESQFIQLGEDAGMYNRNARKLLAERLQTRNLCGHPTGYKPGREETVIFVESLMLNVLGGSMMNW
jgi:hypothetical protein